MSPVLKKRPATLELTSNTPIAAGMRMFFGNETAFSAGAQPFDGPAAVSGLPVRSASDVRVAITAPEGAAQVDVTLLPFRGGKDAAQATQPRRISIGAGRPGTFEGSRPNRPGRRWPSTTTTRPLGASIRSASRMRCWRTGSICPQIAVEAGPEQARGAVFIVDKRRGASLYPTFLWTDSSVG